MVKMYLTAPHPTHQISPTITRQPPWVYLLLGHHAHSILAKNTRGHNHVSTNYGTSHKTIIPDLTKMLLTYYVSLILREKKKL